MILNCYKLHQDLPTSITCTFNTAYKNVVSMYVLVSNVHKYLLVTTALVWERHRLKAIVIKMIFM